MSFSWMKPTTAVLSRSLISVLTLSIALSAIAEPIYDNGKDEKKTRVSYAQELSEVKETIYSKQEELEDKKAQLETAQGDLKNLGKYENWDDDDAITARYSAANCECSAKNQCSIDTMLSIGAITEDDITVMSYNAGGKNCAEKTATNANQSNPDISKTPPGRTTSGPVNDGTGGPNGKKDGKCIEVKEVKPTAVANACLGVYKYAKDNGRSSTNLSATCVAKAKQCGLVKLEIDKRKLPRQIDELKADIAKLEKELKKLIARRKSIDKACPDCSAIAEAVDSNRPTLGDYIVGGLQAVSPMVIAGIQAGSYNRALKTGLSAYNSYLNTSLTAYNGYLSNSLQNCQAYIAQGTTTGIPSSPCMSAMWTGGIAQAPGGGGYGIYGGIGFNGAVGAMYGYPGGYAAGYGSYGYGSFSGVIGSAIGGMYGGGYGTVGGMYGPQIGGGIGMGTAIGGLYGGSYGGMYANSMGVGGAYGYGIDPSYQLNAARMQMQQQNLQLSQQQMMEAQYRYGQIATMGNGMYGGGGYGYGGYGYGYGYGGYPATGYGATVIGTAIGSLYGLSY